MKKKENIVIVVLLVLMALAVIGVSYAAFNYSKLGEKVNSITTGAIMMSYEESDNVINLDKALPTKDSAGTTRLKEGEYFDFTISSTISGNVNINYEISAKDVTDSSARKIDGSNIKLYLTRLTDEGEEELMSPETYNEETSANTYTGRPANEMSLYESSMNSSETNNYRLRMYVTEEYNPQGDGGDLKFAVKINVYGKDGDSMFIASNVIKSKANIETLDYNYATEEQQKEMWTFSHEATEQTEALTDYRYIGSDPNNYVRFNNELWRIIGVFTVDDGTGAKEERLKLIRNEHLGKTFSFDNKDTTTGAEDDYGKNNWPDARLNYLLNEGHENEEVGGSLYWNSWSGACYIGSNNYVVTCDFTNIGLKEDARSMISNTLWYLGGIPYYDNYFKDKTTSFYYSNERGKTVYNSTLSPRATSWIGKVGLIYPSDYGYATSGGTITSRSSCLNGDLSNWESDCYNNNWLTLMFGFDFATWTISPLTSSPGSTMSIYSPGNIYTDDNYIQIDVYPTIYLNSSVQIIDGDGSSKNPYILST